MSFLAIAALVLSAPQEAQASGGPLLPEQACFDVRHVRLELEVLPERKAIAGAMTLTARMLHAADEVALHLDSRLAVERIEEQGRELEFEHERGLIRIPVGERAPESELVLRVEYGGKPRVAPRPPWDGGFTWARTRRGEPWIATSCQGEGADLWWPCKDHPSDKPESMDLVITVPAPLFCASNGRLISDETREGKRTTHWRVTTPINNYCVALNIAPYVELETTRECVDGTTYPVTFWALPENEEKAREILPEFVDHLRFYEELLGPYPFRGDKYGVAETPHLGMEHQSIIAYGNEYKRGEFDYDWLHHHELAHEWWANLVTCRDWKDMWIHEGIGTYMQALYLEEKFGDDAYRKEMGFKRRSLQNKRAVAPRAVHDSKQIYFSADGGFDNDIYYKGSWVMHTLRWLTGDEKFFLALRRMAYPDPELAGTRDGRAVRFSDTEEIRSIAERVHGADLSWFFEVYLRQPKLPVLTAQKEGDELVLAWTSPIGGEFPMPVPVRIGEEIHRIEVGKDGARVPLAGEDYKVDPERWLLRAR